jgi:hypothetical protein
MTLLTINTQYDTDLPLDQLYILNIRSPRVFMRRIVFSLLLVCVALFSPCSIFAVSVERITPEELSAKLCSPNLLLLDLRDAELWEKSKIKMKCSRRVDPDDVASWIDNLPRDKEIVLYCCS